MRDFLIHLAVFAIFGLPFGGAVIAAIRENRRNGDA